MPADLATLFAAGTAVTLPDGRAVTVGELTLDNAARLVRFIKDKAAYEYERLPPDLSPAIRKELAAAVMEGLGAGVWDEHGAGVLKAITQPVVIAEYPYLAISQQDDTFTREEARAVTRVEIEARMPDFLAHLKAAVTGPPA